jgi:hypothetical protein
MLRGVEVRDVKELKHKVLRVNLSIETSYGSVVIKGFRISVSPNYSTIWVQVPSLRLGRTYMTVVFFESEDTWKELERFLSNLYLEHFPNTTFEGLSEEDYEEIDKNISY